MDPALRRALKNLQGAFEEGFMTKPEYELRRKALIDGATTFTTPTDDAAATGGGGKEEGKGTKASVFDRLGANAGGKGTDGRGKWDHGGFVELYGKGAAAAKGKGVVKTIDKRGKAAPLSQRAAVEVYRPPKSDLRSKLAAKANPGGGGSKRAALPSKCPW
ncbi:hypothetical protein AB1Y20_003696 [Prymnesium parvum]|uniref:SHOCT domain-containing protein n=1 Tax=Prymnesium parvum TaxID=97485 RepID=A0AB34J5J0_PRYPA|mmetsp:Transcript_47941/g.118688  ORF Transcript_47941/g.118688 Transcript_47941/m.118688 type:complete len:161 (+) Transcript_47941:29-511(+)